LRKLLLIGSDCHTGYAKIFLLAMVGDFLDFIYYVVLHDIISGLVDKFIIGDEME